MREKERQSKLRASIHDNIMSEKPNYTENFGRGYREFGRSLYKHYVQQGPDGRRCGEIEDEIRERRTGSVGPTQIKRRMGEERSRLREDPQLHIPTPPHAYTNTARNNPEHDIKIDVQKPKEPESLQLH